MSKYKDKIAVILVSVALPMLFLVILFSWSDRISDDGKLWGIFQGDMPTYIANAWHTSPETFHLTYSNPYDISADKKAYLVQLPITLLSVLLRCGLDGSEATLLITIVFGTGMFYLLSLLVNAITSERFSRWILFLLLSLGGGLAWVSSLVDQTVGFWSGIKLYEEHYYWWFFNIFRLIMYPFELIHHVVFFLCLYSLIKRDWFKSNLLVVLSMLINPFLSLHMILVQFFVAVTDKKEKIYKKMWFVPMAFLWAYYYQVFLPGNPVFESLIKQHESAYSDPMWVTDLVQGYGFALVGLFCLFDPLFRKRLFADWKGVPFLVLIFVTLALVNNGFVQPLHFARGYLYLGLWVLTFMWLEFSVELGRIKRSFFTALMSVFFAMSLPDNISFLKDQYEIPPEKSLLVLWDDQKAIHDYLNSIEEPQNIFTIEMAMSIQLSALTHHNLLFGTEYTTPDFHKRFDDAKRFLEEGGGDILQTWKVDIVILFSGIKQLKSFDESRWKTVLKNENWIVLKAIK